MLMPHFITTLPAGTARFHLCHQGQQVFGSRHYMTGGTPVAGILYRQGRICDASQPARILDEAHLLTRLGIAHQSRVRAFVRACRLVVESWLLPLRRPVMRRWNPGLE